MYHFAAPRQTLGRKRRPADRLRFQVPAALLLAVGLPAIVAAIGFSANPLLTPNAQISLAGSGVAALAAVWLSRKFTIVPGVAQGAMQVFMLALCFGLVFGMVVAFRLDFSRVILFSGFAFSLFGVMPAILRRPQSARGQYWVVPFGDVDRLAMIGNAHWKSLNQPRLPRERQSGIVADLRAELPEDWERMLTAAALSSIPIYHVKQLEEGITGKVDIEHLSENTLGSLVPNRAYAELKHIADVILALACLPFLLPLFGLVAIAIRLDTPGPVFFQQERMGQRAQPFRVIKFRTMHHSTGRRDDQLAASITRDHDPRITRVGKFLRRTRLDELPQVFNILRGEMSWIGPRPEAIALSDWYSENLPFYDYRHIVKPGITGWAQVNQGHVAELAEVHDKLRFDFYYIKNFSVTLDFVIAARTMHVMLGGFGSR